MGAIGGAIFRGGKEFFFGAKGMQLRSKAAFVGIRTGAPQLGGQFAMWGFTFSSCDCALAKLRRKEDHWNSIGSGFITGGLLTFRQGPVPMFASACVGGVLLAFIEGVGVLMNNMFAEQFKPVDPVVQDPSSLPPKQTPHTQQTTAHDITAHPFGTPNFMG
jgi:import inner membrane translocase subunit TIM17